MFFRRKSKERERPKGLRDEDLRASISKKVADGDFPVCSHPAFVEDGIEVEEIDLSTADNKLTHLLYGSELLNQDVEHPSGEVEDDAWSVNLHDSGLWVRDIKKEQ